MQQPFINFLISLLLFSSNLFFPQFGFVITLFAPIFLIKFFLDEKRGKLDNILFGAVSAGIFLFSFYFAVYYMVICVFPAVVIYFHRRKVFDGKIDIILVSSIPVLLFSIIILVFLSDYKTAISDYLVSYLRIVIENYEKVADPANYNTYIYVIKNNMNSIVFNVIHLMPAFSFVYVSFVAAVAKRYYLRKYVMAEPRYKVNEKLIILLLAGGFLIISNNPYLKLVSYNTLIIFGILFFYQGADIVNFYMNKFKIRIFLRFIIYFLIFSWPHIIAFLAVAGLVDNWFDLTEIRFKRKNNT